MGKQFRFTDEQRKYLQEWCWKRPADRVIAAAYLLDIEHVISEWKCEIERHPPSLIREQISHAECIQHKAAELLQALDGLPKDVADQLNVTWLRLKYGDAYFEQHREACRKDKKNKTALRNAFISGLNSFAPDRHQSPQLIQTELSKLPLDFIQHTEIVLDYLRVLVQASGDVSDMHKQAKQWHNKEAEERLLLGIALAYEHHFGKLPSSANSRTAQPESASPFRKLVRELEAILNLELGAPLIRNAITILNKYRKDLRTVAA